MKLELAPLAGFTDAPFRRLCGEFGSSLSYTEMVSAAALAHGSSPTLHLLETMPGEGPLACQLFGAKEDEMAKAAEIVSAFPTKFVEINLNAGCPMTKVTRCGAGAKLVENPSRIHSLLKAIKSNTDLPVTLKTRLGPHPQLTNIFEIADAAESAGASKLIVHARYTSQMHGGLVHLDVLKDLVSRAKIPIVGNGSVTDLKSLETMASTGVSAIMIGRAAVNDPTVFAIPNRPFVNRMELCRRHLSYLLEFRDMLASKYPSDHIPGPDAFASVKMHVHLFRYFKGLPEAAAIRARLNTIRSLSEIYQIIDSQSRV